MSSLVITFLSYMLFMRKVHTAQISVSYGAVLSIKLITCHLVWADVYLWHCLQVPYALNYSLIFYFVTNEEITEGSLLHQFISGDDTFRNSRLSLIPAIPEVSVTFTIMKSCQFLSEGEGQGQQALIYLRAARSNSVSQEDWFIMVHVHGHMILSS